METMNTAPLTPRAAKEKIDAINLKIFKIVDTLSYKWSLGIDPDKPGDSPSKRSKGPQTIEKEIKAKIKALCFREAIDPLVEKFNQEAQILYTGWVHKPKAERGVLPERTRHSRIAITEKERTHLLRCLLGIVTEEYDATMTPKKKHLAASNANASMRTTGQRRMDDSPIPFPISKPKNDSKRSRDQVKEDDEGFKRPRLPQQASDSMSRAQSGSSMHASVGGTYSAKTSFASEISSIFSNPNFNNSNRSLPEVLTQETIPSQPSPNHEDAGTDMKYRDTLETSFGETTQSSSYEGGSSFDAALLEVTGSNTIGIGQSDPIVDDELSQDMLEQVVVNDHTELEDVEELDLISDELRVRLRRVFPQPPTSLHNLPLCVAYEVTRVFLHAGVSLSEARFSPSPNFSDYDYLWTFLKSLPSLQGKSFPDQCAAEIWDAAIKGNFRREDHAVFMSGSLRFHPVDETGPLFQLQLQPFALDLSHRTGRQFGHDRLLELDIPSLVDKRAPKLLQQLGKRGSSIVIDWLVDESHQLLGRLWKPFFLKPKERSNRKAVTIQQSTDPDPIHRIYFFAVDGTGFIKGRIPVNYLQQLPVKMSIELLLNRIRPIRKNIDQNYLKLFSRTALALSRNTPTVILEKSQIRYKGDILSGEEIMTDGAGRISRALAMRVAQTLGLSYLPSAFQGRLGEAKGVWSVHHQEDMGSEEWIEVYKSQRKWIPSSKPNGESDDISHRTFEVLKYSTALKPASLNLQFLPLLIDRAKSESAMRNALSQILVEGLRRELANLRNSMDIPQSFRKWVHQSNPNLKERLTQGAVRFQAGLPVSPEERMNVLLDAGFDPKKLLFMKEIARTIFKNKCNELKSRLNITVPRSTNVLMIPDFLKILKPGEVYIDLSNFPDHVSGLSGVFLNGMELLVARSPAHYPSDIQKVRAVMRSEYMFIKDCIVFPTTGTPSLAKKLSGGDFDGDIAWTCWEPSLVDQFINTNVPQCPDLVELGYLRKESTSYKELVEGHPNPTSTFLKRSFEFNMRPSLLGKCTVWKEELCYTQDSISTPEAIFLSTLLSALVDALKQGYVFEEADRLRIQQEIVKIKTCKPLYKTNELGSKATHIIDRLKIVATETVESALREFHEGFKDPPKWDEDLVSFYFWAKKKANDWTDWDKLLCHLDAEISTLKKEWANCFNKDPKDESKTEFVPIKLACYEKFKAIRPHEDTPFTQILDPDCFPDPDVSPWALLKASALFASYKPDFVKNAVWWLAGKQLCQLKAMWVGDMAVVAPYMYAIMRPDGAIVKALESRELATNIERGEELDDDDDD